MRASLKALFSSISTADALEFDKLSRFDTLIGEKDDTIYITNSTEETDLLVELINHQGNAKNTTRAAGYTSVSENLGDLPTRIRDCAN